MINKKGFLTRDIVITGLLFTGIIALFVLAIAGVNSNYPQENIIDEEFSDDYDKLTEVTEQIDIGRKASQSGQGLSFLGTFDVVFSATFTVLTAPFVIIGLLGDITAKFVSDFTFLDASVVKLLFTVGIGVITIILVYSWISSISRGKV